MGIIVLLVIIAWIIILKKDWDYKKHLWELGIDTSLINQEEKRTNVELLGFTILIIIFLLLVFVLFFVIISF